MASSCLCWEAVELYFLTAYVCAVQDVCDKTVSDAEVLPINPPRDDWLAHKVLSPVLKICRSLQKQQCLVW